MHEFAKPAAQLFFLAGGSLAFKFQQHGGARVSQFELLRGQEFHFAELPSLDDGPAYEFERFEFLKCISKVYAARHHSMIFQNDTVAALAEFSRGGCSQFQI